MLSKRLHSPLLKKTNKNIKSTLLVTVFSIIVIGSSISIVASTINYAEFYRATRDVKITNLNVATIVNEESVNINLTFRIANPTGYTGLKLREVTCDLKYEDNGNFTTLWWTINSTGSKPLNPFSEIPFEWILTQLEFAKGEESAQLFRDCYESHQGAVRWRLFCGVILITFLGEVQLSFSESYPP